MKKVYCTPSTDLLPLQCESMICSSVIEQNGLGGLSAEDYSFDFELIF